METKHFDLLPLKVTSSANLQLVFGNLNRSYINEVQLFAAYFNTIPNIIIENNIDCKNANLWFVATYKEDIQDSHFIKLYFDRSKKAEYDDIFYFIYDDLIVNFDTNCSKVRFLFKRTDSVTIEKISTAIKKFKKKKQKQNPEILLLIRTDNGITTKSLSISRNKLGIADNYNDDFTLIHQTITKRLSKKNDKGLVLLHGKPGTGKTSYIRYLIAELKKDVIFLPPNMAGAITDPNLISILIENPNSILVIEDAEKIIVDREKDGHSPVSALLNLSDGLLADCLNVQIICSFNTDISKVDTALMRKGRLIAKYEFKELETAKAQKLSNKLKFNTNIQKPMTLTEIYNQNEVSFQQTQHRNTIGFFANNN